MKSLETSILLYALNADCTEHDRARTLVESALGEADRWIVADQVYFELYRLLRNTSVLTANLSAADATRTIEWYRTRSGWLHCAYDPRLMPLATNGVREFHTRNTADFAPFELFTLCNPIDTE